MAETDNGWGIACRMAADVTSVWLGTLTDTTRASISSNDSDALESDMRAAIRAALHEHTDQLRFRPCPDGPDVEPDVLMGEDTTGWERLDGPPEGEP